MEKIMSNRILAFIDESGNHGTSFEKNDVSSHFIITAIVIEKEKLSELETQMTIISKKFFQQGEMKSSSIGKNHIRRVQLLEGLLEYNFKIFSLVIDKRKIYENSGLRYKKSFYKFLNNLLHEELRSKFRYLTICADELGGNEFMSGFSKYVKEKSKPLDLFGEYDFYFKDSKNHILIQLADIISGTLSYVYEDTKRETHNVNYLEILSKHVLYIEHWPKNTIEYIYSPKGEEKDYDQEIARIALDQVQRFITNNKSNENEDVKLQLIVIDYLAFRFIHNQERKYIPTKELLTQLRFRTGKDIKVHYFRTKIIAKLRDAEVIIASSSKGYKIPSKQAEVYDFINHGTSVVMPMLNRLKICRDVIQLSSLGNLDVFDHTEYGSLRKYFEE